MPSLLSTVVLANEAFIAFPRAFSFLWPTSAFGSTKKVSKFYRILFYNHE